MPATKERLVEKSKRVRFTSFTHKGKKCERDRMGLLLINKFDDGTYEIRLYPHVGQKYLLGSSLTREEVAHKVGRIASYYQMFCGRAFPEVEIPS